MELGLGDVKESRGLGRAKMYAFVGGWRDQSEVLLRVGFVVSEIAFVVVVCFFSHCDA